MECSRKKTSVCRIWPSGPNKGAQDVLFTLEKHLSSIDQEVGPRLMFTKSPRMDWWPSGGAQLLRGHDRRKTSSYENGLDYLCALHRKDSFLLLNSSSTGTRIAVYGWNGLVFPE